MYKVIVKFADLKDYSYIYEVGDEYPRKGYAPSEERLKELLGNKNKLRVPIIEAVIEESPKEEEVKPKRKKKVEVKEDADEK